MSESMTHSTENAAVYLLKREGLDTLLKRLLTMGYELWPRKQDDAIVYRKITSSGKTSPSDIVMCKVAGIIGRSRR